MSARTRSDAVKQRPQRPASSERARRTGKRSPVKRITTARGVRLSQHGVVLSEVLRRPGPTHSVADVIAAAIHWLDRGSQVAVLGFAGGGLVAPLRALGSKAVVEGVDLDVKGYHLFQKLCSSWAGEVRFSRGEAVRWLAGRRTGADYIVDDLSVAEGRDVIKPPASWVDIPGLIRNRLGPDGVAVLNWLPPDHKSWRATIRVTATLFPCVRVVFLDDFENRILLGGRQLPSAGELSRGLRRCLDRLGSRQASRIAVRAWPC